MNGLTFPFRCTGITAVAFGHRLAGQLGNIGFGHFGQQPKANAKGTKGFQGDVLRTGARAAQNLA